MDGIIRIPLLTLAVMFESVGKNLRRLAHAIPVFPPPKKEEFSPLGYWRCTHSGEGLFAKHFRAGGIYRATHMPAGTSCVRVIPSEHKNWAPYWDRFAGRFCYEPDQLDFEYVGPCLPAGEHCLSS